MTLTQEQVRELFDYVDGQLLWKKAHASRKIGEPAGYWRADGYLHVRIAGVLHYGHRLIWLWHHGDVPEYVDHKDRNPRNNRIENLRPATRAENLRNRKKKRGTSKYLGVHLAKKRGKWMAQMTAGGPTRHLGSFDSEEEAAHAYDVAARELHGEFASLNFGVSGDEAGEVLATATGTRK